MRISKIGGFQYRYRRFKEALERIVATTVKSEGAFYNKTKQEWVEDVFHRFLWKELTCLRYCYSPLYQLLPITRQRYFSNTNSG